MKIAHLTNVHPRGDTRVRVKEVGTLAQAFGEPVALIVQDGKGDSVEEGGRVRIIDTGPPPGNRLARMTIGVWRMGRATLATRPQVAHFHDPELMMLGFALKCLGYQVVYDAHEDVPRQMLVKFWLPAWIRRPVSWVMVLIEWLAGRVFDAIVPAEPEIAKRFPSAKTVLVQNFSIPAEFETKKAIPYQERPPHFAYVGAISLLRGAREMVEALGRLHSNDGVRLRLAGVFQPAALQAEIETMPNWVQGEFLGWTERRQTAELLGSVRAGLATLHPTQKYQDAYPVKMFEYMAAGLPVIASDFPLWRRLMERGGKCGILVNPQDPQAIAQAMRWILEHPAEAEEMGRRGREAARQYYNWDREADKLIALYRNLLTT